MTTVDSFAQCNVQPNAPRRGSFSLRGYTTGDTWANWESKVKLRGDLVPFVLIKLECVRWCRGCCQSPRQHNEHSTSAARKENTCETQLALLQVPNAPSQSWYIYISPWALHLLVIHFICSPPVQYIDRHPQPHPHLCNSSWAACLTSEHLALPVKRLCKRDNWVKCSFDHIKQSLLSFLVFF